MHLNGSVRNAVGIETHVPEFGSTEGIEELYGGDLDPLEGITTYLYDLVEYFVRRGYKRGKDIRSAPYDWRYDPGLYMHINNLVNPCQIVCQSNLPRTYYIRDEGLLSFSNMN